MKLKCVIGEEIAGPEAVIACIFPLLPTIVGDAGDNMFARVQPKLSYDNAPGLERGGEGSHITCVPLLSFSKGKFSNYSFIANGRIELEVQ